MKKYISLILVVIMLVMTTSAFAYFSDVPQGAAYENALKRISDLGIISGFNDGTFKPNDILTREQFATLIIRAAGLDSNAQTLKGATIFPDVEAERWSSGYINAALSKGYISGMPDGKFYPDQGITFGQACTLLVRALGYTDQDVTGQWPKNYVDKARTLGLTPGVSLGNNDLLPRWAAVVMIDRLLITNMKSSGAAGTAKTFADASGIYSECIILADSNVSDKLADRQIQTDKGIFYVAEGLKLELGEKYNLVLNSDTVIHGYKETKNIKKVVVDSAVDTKITFNENGMLKSFVLPDKTAYYYNGQKQTYDNLKNILQTNTSIIFAYNDTMTGYEYAVIVDPMYSKPEIAKNFNPFSGKIGSIEMGNNPRIVKNGEIISINQIEDNDLVYRVSDIWNTSSYILVVSNKIEGKITGITPNKLSPVTVQINNKNYNLSKYFNFNKINNTPGAFKIDDSVVALLGYDGKIVDLLYPESEDNSNFAFVLNYSYSTSKNIADYGKVQYFVKLLFTDGTTGTYKIGVEPMNYKAKLVKYTKVDDQTVSLEEVQTVNYGEININKDAGLVNNNYITNNIKIFNLASNEQGADAKVEILGWNDMPYGTIPEGKVLYMNKIGEFEDINVMLLDDIFDTKYKTGVITKIETSKRGPTYTLLIGGQEYQYSTSYIPDVAVGDVLKVKLANTGISSIVEIKKAEAEAQKIQAIDTARIKINGIIYKFKDNVAIYFKDYSGNITMKGISDIDTSKVYGRVSIYLDKPLNYGGKVELIIISE